MATPVSVSQLNRYVKMILEGDGNLSGILVRGEISNLTIYHRSGHCYFSLKDSNATVKAVMFKWNLDNLRFVPKDGMAVIVQASATLFEGTGNYQLNVTSIIPDGEGDLSIAYEQLKEKLLKEGLFDEDRKRSIPTFPKRICVITSATGAVIQDIKNVLSRRFPLVTLTLIHSKVQGEGAAKELISALEYGDNIGADCIIIGRGGGSAEDLWCFNDEKLVRKVAATKTPIISAVGHETDFTLCDFAADLRAPTPSAAAELATPDIAKLMDELDDIRMLLKLRMSDKLSQYAAKLDALEMSLYRVSPENKLKLHNTQLESKKSQLFSIMTAIMARKEMDLSSKAKILNSLSPLEVLGRGYSYTTNRDGKVISSLSQVEKGHEIRLYLSDGTVKATVDSKRRKQSKTANAQ